MSDQPPPLPVKHRLAEPAPVVTPKRVTVMPPKPPRRSHWEAMFRLVIVSVIVISVGVAYWNFFHRLLPLQKQARSMITKVSDQSTTLDQWERSWTPEQVEAIRARYREVYQHLFADEAALAAWLTVLQTQATPLALDIDVTFGAGVPREEFSTNLAMIPASISLEVQPANGDARDKSPYERVLEFGQHLASHGKRADLAELTVTGGVGSVSKAYLLFNLWAGDLGVEAPTAAANTNTR